MADNINIRKIAIDLTHVQLSGENGGAKVFVIELIKQISFAHKDTQFLLLTNNSSSDELSFLDCYNVKRVLVNHAALGFYGVLNKLFDYFGRALPKIKPMLTRAESLVHVKLKKSGRLSKMGVDLLFCPFSDPAFAENGLPCVSVLYDMQYKSYPQFFSESELAQRDRTFIAACARATSLVTISDYSRLSIAHHGKLPPDSITTIHLRLADRFSTLDSDAYEVLATYGLVCGRYLIYPANFWSHKNHEILFTAFAIACKTGLPADIKLVCTGSQLDRLKYLKSITSAFNIQERVVLTGYVSSDELRGILYNACGLIFPSLYEGFGMPVIEAMAASIPVACSNCTSLPEVAGEAALLFDPKNPQDIANRILELVNDERIREKLIHAGRERSLLFQNTHRMVEEYWDVFRSALAKHKS